MTGSSQVIPVRESSDIPVTIGELLQQAVMIVDYVDARWLLQSVLSKNAAYLISHTDQLLDMDHVSRFRQLLARRVAGEPVAYLTGERGFYDLVFEVTPDVLIPRPETELLVEMALTRIPAGRKCNVLDLGTGSGAIAVTFAKHRPDACVVAVDSSSRALAVAHRNAEKHAVKNVVFIEADWFSCFTTEKFDVIMANPPYIAEADPHLEKGDLRFEPTVALTAGSSGQDCLRSIITQAPGYLEPSGWLMLEHGYDQAATCHELLDKTGFTRLFTEIDLAGMDRVTGGQYV